MLFVYNNLELKLMETKETIYREADYKASIFNMRLLSVLCFFALLALLLNELGLFVVPRLTMFVSTFLSSAIFLTPIAVHLISDKIIKKKTSVVSEHWFKILIVVSFFLGIVIVGITLSHHALILLALPPLVASSYSQSKKYMIVVFVISILMVPITVYGSFIFGSLDRNFIKGMLTDEEANVIENRLELLTSKRMLDVFLHYVIPRLLCELSICVIAYANKVRNELTLKKQEELYKIMNDEMERVNKLQSHVIDELATLIETRDVSTGEHVLRTRRYVKIIASALMEDGKFKDILNPKTIALMENAAPLHDVGKITISDTILLKPAKLTNEEFDKIKTHTYKGKETIAKVFSNMNDEEFLKTAEEIAISHHEKWDGTGYPYGLKGDNIPLSGRIMAIADVYDALVSLRFYKPPITPEESIKILMSESGTHFDPSIMETVKRIESELIKEAKADIFS